MSGFPNQNLLPDNNQILNSASNGRNQLNN